jgi:hypothetical protein
VGVDEATGKILAAVVTTNDIHDGEVLNDGLKAIEGDIEQVLADGAYGHRHCWEEISERGDKPGIPPRKDAVIWQHGNCKAAPHPRDENLRSIRKHGRKKWKRDCNYHRRLLAETTMSRFKAILGGNLGSRNIPLTRLGTLREGRGAEAEGQANFHPWEWSTNHNTLPPLLPLSLLPWAIFQVLEQSSTILLRLCIGGVEF